MKKILFLMILVSSLACSKDKCVSCIALSEQKEIVEHTILCDRSTSYIQGLKDGIIARYKDQGKNVQVTCKFN